MFTTIVRQHVIKISLGFQLCHVPGQILVISLLWGVPLRKGMAQSQGSSAHCFSSAHKVLRDPAPVVD